MAARIRSLQNGINPVDSSSRDDLVSTDVVTVSSIDAATTYEWTLVFVPDGSAATFSGSVTAVSPGSFTVDLTGAYLVRLIVDAGLPTEDTQYVRLRSLTTTLGLRLVAAGERRDGSGIIPVDIDAEGWANEQNANLLALEGAATGISPLATILGTGNTTGGNNIIVTTGDEIRGQTSLVLRADNNVADNIGLTPGSSGAVIVNGKLTITGLAYPTGVVYTEAGPPATTATEGAVFVSDGAAGLTQGELYYRPASSGTPRKAARFRVPYHINLPEVPNDTVEYRGWVPEACTLISARAYMTTLNTQGTYILAVTNEGTGNTCLVGATFNMNTLVADTVTDLTLTGTGADLVFAEKGRWTISLTSNDLLFDGTGIYIELGFEV